MSGVLASALLPCLLFFASAHVHAASSTDALVFLTEKARLTVSTFAQGLDSPWGLAFLPGGRMLVTERPGRMRLVGRDGRLGEPLDGLPKVLVLGQGGLLDVAVDPQFARNRLVYFSYAELRPDGNGTTVARARLRGTTLADVTVIFRQLPAADSPAHFGSRLVFARDGRLFITLGERNLMNLIHLAQDPGTHFGKVIRIERDGRVPPDNPFVGRAGSMPEVWTLGHRNPQGAALHPRTGELWVTEHGPRGGDELNRLEAGHNYGWPVITYGLAYSGAKIFGSEGTEKPGLEQPMYHWVPSIGTSGLAFYAHSRLPAWRDNAFVGGLVSTSLSRLELQGNRVVHEERMLAELRERIRDVRVSQDGSLYLLTDNPNGRILRVVPAP